MKKLLTALLILTFTATISRVQAQYERDEQMNQTISNYLQLVSADSIQQYMQTLQNFGTRFCLANNRRQVATWIKDKFISFGYQDTQLDSFAYNTTYNGTYYQTWQYNVVANYPGYANPNQIYVMGAHYDAIVPNSSSPFVNAPGADDNASGVAAAIEVARIMKQYNYIPEKTIRFMAFGAEELGLHGAWNYATKAQNQNMNIVFMLNNDMISYCTLPPSQWKLRIQKYPNSQNVTNLAINIAQNFTSLSVTEGTQYIQSSDSWPFYSKGYKAIFLQEDQFTPFYHTVNDLVANSNMAYTAEMVKVSLGMLISENGTGTPTGSNCTDPLLVNLPIINYQGSTAIYGNTFSPGWITGNPAYASNFISGNDLVFQFTLPVNSIVSGSIACPQGNNAGLFITNTCPNPLIPAQILQFAGGMAGGSFENLLLEAGTYYAIVSNKPLPIFTSFTLNLSAQPASQLPELVISPVAMNFGIINNGNQSPSQEFTLRNFGNAPLNISDITLTGTNANQFLITSQSGTLPLSLQFGQMAQVAVAFAPTQIGQQTAFLSVSSNTPSVQQMPLVGTGYGDLVISTPYTQDFTNVNPGQMPSGWMQTGSYWSISNTNFSGGTVPELKFAGITGAFGSYHLMMNPVNALANSTLQISFKSMLDDNPSNEGAFSLKLQSSTDGGLNWVNQWAMMPSGSLPSETYTADLNSLAGEFFMLAWVFEGEPNEVYGWFIDDIEITGSTQGIIAGDSNCDGIVNVLDVIATINYIVGTNPAPFCLENADANQDGIINVLDVIATVNLITGGKKMMPAGLVSAESHLTLEPNSIRLNSDGTLAGLQFEIMGSHLDLLNLRLNLPGFEFAQNIMHNKLMGLIYSLENKLIPYGNIELFRFSGNQSNLRWGQVVAGNLNAQNVPVVKSNSLNPDIFAEDYKILAFPNPAKGDFTVNIAIPYHSYLTLRILDIVGREIVKLYEGNLFDGEHAFRVERNNLPNRGVYLLHIEAIPAINSESIISRNLKLIVQ